MWGPEEMKPQFLSRWSFWQICSAYGSYSACCTLSQLWWTGVFPLALFRSESPSCHSCHLCWDGCQVLHTQCSKAGRKGALAQLSRTWPECISVQWYLKAAALGTAVLHVLREGEQAAPKVLTNGKDTEVALWAALSTPKQQTGSFQRRITQRSQAAAAWPTAAVLCWSEGWRLEVVSETERGYISLLFPTVAPRS